MPIEYWLSYSLHFVKLGSVGIFCVSVLFCCIAMVQLHLLTVNKQISGLIWSCFSKRKQIIRWQCNYYYLCLCIWNRKSSARHDVLNNGTWAASYSGIELCTGSNWYCNAGCSQNWNWWSWTANYVPVWVPHFSHYSTLTTVIHTV